MFVRNVEDFDAIHAVRRQYFTGIPPASTMVEVSKFVNKDYLIEINAIAVIQGCRTARALTAASRPSVLPIGNGQSLPNTSRSGPITRRTSSVISG